jgi:acylphosphatase
VPKARRTNNATPGPVLRHGGTPLVPKDRKLVNDMTKMIRVHLLISGRVQGVLFRQHARAKALELGLTGWVKNFLDGKVEIVVEGEQDKIKEFVKWAKQGSPLARVENIEIAEEEYTGEFKEFLVREFGF